MNNQIVQAMIIKEKEIFCAYGSNSNNSRVQFFVRGDVREGENEESAIKRAISEQLNTQCEITFIINKDQYNKITTFLVEIEDIKNVKNKTNEIPEYISGIKVEGYKWVFLLDINNYDRPQTNYLRLLVEECINRDFKPSWYNTVVTLVLSNQDYRYSNSILINKKNKKDRENLDLNVTSKEKMITIFLALMLGIFFNLFYVGKYVGVSSLIYNLMLFVLFFWSLRDKIKVKKNMGWFMIIPTLLLSLSYAIYANEVLRIINAIVVPLLMVVTNILIVQEDIAWGSTNFIGRVLKRIVNSSFQNIFKPFKFTKEIISRKDTHSVSPAKKHIIKGLVISIPLLTVILILLTSADMMFRYYILNISNAFSGINTFEFIYHFIIILGSFLYIFGYVWSYKYPFEEEKSTKVKKATWEPITVLTVIFVINIVYLAFTVIQASYLYSGVNSSLPKGFTYAEYARKGFFELVVVTIINFTILLCCLKFMNKENKKLNIISNVLLTCLVMFTFNMLFSAHYKMSLYENTFGYTRLRIYVQLFMLLLSILIVIAFASIWYKKIPIAKFIIIASLLMYVIVNYINIDRIIAKENIDRHNKKEIIDINYLTKLSNDALPETIKMKNDPDSKISSEVRAYIEKEKSKKYDYSWYEFNYSKYRANKLLNK